MKLISALIVVFLSAIAANVEKNSCEPWPPSLEPMQACCILPEYLEQKASLKCDELCDKGKIENHSECFTVCYVGETQIIKNGALDKATIKQIFNDTQQGYYYLHFNSSGQKQVVNEAVDACEYKSTGKISKDLATFYDCVRNFTARNCIVHEMDLFCDASIEFNEKCRKVQTNCDEWPDFQVPRFAEPKFCCNYPNIVTNDHYNKFMTTCQKREFLTHKKFECMYNETVKEAGVKKNENFDFEVLKKMLVESSNKSVNWESSIDKSILTCKGEMKGLKS